MRPFNMSEKKVNILSLLHDYELKPDVIMYAEHIYSKYLDIRVTTGKSLAEWLEPLANSFTNDGAIPYLLDTTERYRASPLSSAIIWMANAGILSEHALLTMQNKLFELKDKNQDGDLDAGIEIKKEEDAPGWSLGEGVSVWSTSLGIIAVLQQNKLCSFYEENLKDTVIWLAQQQDINAKGWAYQAHRNCQVNIIMTSLALQALTLVYKNISKFNFIETERHLLLTAITNGFLYIKGAIIKKKLHMYWEFMEKPSSTATAWSLIALNEACGINEIDNIKEFYSKIKDRCLGFILKSMPSEYICWPDEQIVCEAGAKYSKQKNYYSFMPTLIPQLLTLGISPFNEKIINQVKWLIENSKSWKIVKYDQSIPCSFTYAMVIATLVDWHFRVGKNLSRQLLDGNPSYLNRIFKYSFGINFFKKEPIVIIYKTRFLSTLVLLAAICVVSFFYKHILDFLLVAYSFLCKNWENFLVGTIIFLVTTSGGLLFRFYKRKIPNEN